MCQRMTWAPAMECQSLYSADRRDRRGPMPAGLYRYMLARDIDMSGWIVVELEGERATDGGGQ